jgi:hypothetical protein
MTIGLRGGQRPINDDSAKEKANSPSGAVDPPERKRA